jgi:AraC family transcriptional regulator, transcriptional activator of the genes for pyochelin and ferripyochelin receptors
MTKLSDKNIHAMPITFQNTDQKEFYRNSTSLAQLNNKQFYDSREAFAFDGGSMIFYNAYFNGFRLAHSTSTHQQQAQYHVRNDVDTVKLYFNRKGNTSMEYTQFQKRFTIKEGQYNMLYAPELDTTISHLNDTSNIFSLQLTKDCFRDMVDSENAELDNIANRISKNHSVLLSDRWFDFGFDIEKCISDIINCQYTNEFKKYYLHAKATELFILALGPICYGHRRSAAFIKKDSDIEKFHAVKDFIRKNYSNPTSLYELSKTFGLNEYKLKRGFKELFNISVIDFLITCRLEHGKYLLRDTNKSVSEVAYQIGYSSPEHFSKAFKKKYGISPSKI